MATGVSADQWASEGVRAIRTAAQILKEQEEESKGKGGRGGRTDGRQTSG